HGARLLRGHEPRGPGSARRRAYVPALDGLAGARGLPRPGLLRGDAGVADRSGAAGGRPAGPRRAQVRGMNVTFGSAGSSASWTNQWDGSGGSPVRTAVILTQFQPSSRLRSKL